MILVIDNYDSFVHNLARYFRLEGSETHIIRNDSLSVEAVLQLQPAAVVLSPGPKTPKDAGICLTLLGQLPASTPLLGVCLGHQCLVEVLGGRTVKAQCPLHGQGAQIHHDGEGVFTGLPSPMSVGRYHSLISTLESDDLMVSAESDEGEIMAVRRREHPWFGVQFHPESVLTPNGRDIIRNFLKYVQ